MRATPPLMLSICLLAVLGGRAVGMSEAAAAGTLQPLALPATLAGLSASGTAPRFSIGTYGGVEYGTAKELVYFTGGGYDHYKVSELDWPLQPSYYLGANLDLRSNSALSIGVDLRGALPSDVGYVQDSDYLNGDGLRTNYSRHTGVLLGAFAARADIGWRFALPAGLTITPFARFAFLDIKWSAEDGYYQYPPQTSPPYAYWSPNEPKVYLSGQVATYEQRYLIPAAGLEGELDSGGVLSLGVAVAFSPLAWISDIDHHFLRNLIFFDKMSLSTYVEPTLRLAFRPARVFALTLALSYFSVTSRPDGLIVTRNTFTGLSTSSAGSGSTSGASIETVSATIGIRIRR